jgi:hypothetical protein
MALFDLLKKVQKVVDVVSTVIESEQNSSQQQTKYSRQQSNSRLETAADYIPAGAPAKDAYSYRGRGIYRVENYFQELLINCFPEYTISVNHSIAPSPAVPVTFMLLQGGIPRLAIIVCGSNEYRTRRIQATVDACRQLRIPVQRYYREFRNDSNYVIQRVQSGLLGK